MLLVIPVMVRNDDKRETWQVVPSGIPAMMERWAMAKDNRIIEASTERGPKRQRLTFGTLSRANGEQYQLDAEVLASVLAEFGGKVPKDRLSDFASQLFSGQRALAMRDPQFLPLTEADREPSIKQILEKLIHIENYIESERAEKESASQHTPRVPKYAKVKRRWVATWKLVKPRIGSGDWSTIQTIDWLERSHPRLKVSEEILSDIIRAGEFGLLD